MKRLVLLGISAAILAVIYRRIDPWAILNILKHAAPGPLAWAALLLAATTLLSAARLRLLLPPDRRLGLGTSLRLILAASVLNLILPARSGDLLQSLFMRRHGGISGTLAAALVVFEKTTDLLALLVWCAAGLALRFEDAPFFRVMLAVVVAGLAAGIALLASPRLADILFALALRLGVASMADRLRALRGSWHEMHALFWRAWPVCIMTMALSMLIWFLHLLQFWLMARALGAPLPMIVTLALVPLAILAGLLPLTLAGIGTRDAALIALLRSYMSPATGAALGVLATLRYLLPALAGLPALQRYLGELGSARAR
jgi:uncharacterized protein (TIRG00374 family)